MLSHYYGAIIRVVNAVIGTLAVAVLMLGMQNNNIYFWFVERYIYCLLISNMPLNK